MNNEQNYHEILQKVGTINDELKAIGTNGLSIRQSGGFFTELKTKFFTQKGDHEFQDRFYTLSEKNGNAICTFTEALPTGQGNYSDFKMQATPVPVKSFLNSVTDTAAQIVSKLPDFKSKVPELQAKLVFSAPVASASTDTIARTWQKM